MNYEIIKTANLIKELYDTDDGLVGGYGHIVFDDDNLDDNSVNWCLESANKKKDVDCLSEQTRIASIKALEAMLKLNEHDREIANNYFWNTLNTN